MSDNNRRQMANQRNEIIEETELQQIRNEAPIQQEDDENKLTDASEHQQQVLVTTSSTAVGQAASASSVLGPPSPIGPPPSYEEIYPVQSPYLSITNTSLSYPQAWLFSTPSQTYPVTSIGQTVTSTTEPFSTPLRASISPCPLHSRLPLADFADNSNIQCSYPLRQHQPYNSRQHPPIRRHAPLTSHPAPSVHIIGGQITRPARISSSAKWFFTTITLIMIFSIICALLYIIFVTTTV